jgi:hypothetical protein
VPWLIAKERQEQQLQFSRTEFPAARHFIGGGSKAGR